MNVSGSHGSRFVSFDTGEKTVHKSDVDNLARSIKTVLQSSSKMIVDLKSQKLPGDQQRTNTNSLDALRETLAQKQAEVVFFVDEMARSSYKHADFKRDKLESLAKKIDSTIDSLERAEVSCLKKNPFLVELCAVRNQKKAEGSKLDQNEYNQNKIQWVHDER
jgi:hypothetical protein